MIFILITIITLILWIIIGTTYLKLHPFLVLFTAEGKLDYQSLSGKVPIQLGKLAKKHNKILICLAGSIEPPYQNFYRNGISGIFNIQNKPISLDESMKDAENQISDISSRVFSFFEKIQ